MKPEQVTDEMTAAAHSALYAASVHDLDATDDELRATLAAALTAMPDALLRELVRERGWVMVPRGPTQVMLVAARDWSHSKYGKPIGNDAAIGCWGTMLVAAEASGKEVSK